MPLTASSSARSLETGPSTPPRKGGQLGQPQVPRHLTTRPQRPSTRLADRVAAAEHQEAFHRLRDKAVRRLRSCVCEDGAGLLLVLALVLGVTLGLAMPADSEMPYPWNRIGEVLSPCALLFSLLRRYFKMRGNLFLTYCKLSDTV